MIDLIIGIIWLVGTFYGYRALNRMMSFDGVEAPFNIFVAFIAWLPILIVYGFITLTKRS